MNRFNYCWGILFLLPNVTFAEVAETEASKTQNADQNTENVLVIGRAQQFYLEKTSTVGTKTDTDILDVPQSIQVLSSQLIADQAARDITDLYRSIAGVSEFSYSGVTFRGFRDSDNVFYDGVRGDPYSGFAVPQLFNVERVEILKGPAGALYGSGQPGGMINYVTKKPTFEDDVEVVLSAGNFSTRGASIDATGGLNSSVAYRLGAYYQKEDSFRNNADARNVEIAGGLLFELGKHTQLTTTFDYIDQDLGGNRLRGVPVDDNGNFIVDRSYNANEKSDFQDLEAVVVQAILDHRFSDNLTSRFTLRSLQNERTQKYHESRSWVDVNGDGEANIDDETIRREYRDQYRANDEISFTADFVYKFNFSGFQHQLLFGGDAHKVDTEYEYYRARYEADGVGNLNVFHPNYGETDPSAYNLTDLSSDGTKAARNSVYIQDQIELSARWNVLLGLRYDSFEDTDKGSDYSFDDNAIIPRAGIVFKPFESTSWYLNYSESFIPVSLGNQETVEAERALEPETGNQIELGVKSEFFDGSVMTSFAVYKIVKQDLPLSNPQDTGPDDGIPALINLGEVESEGFEATVVGDLASNWTVTANYAYNDTVVVEGSGLTNTFGDGARFTNAPEHQAGVWTRFDFPSMNSALAFGVDYVSEQVSFDEQRVKPFTVYDMSWNTTWNDTLFRLNVSNLFDKEYAVSGFSERNGHFPGAPREILMQVSRSF
ncbi:Ferrichrome-iron receptor [Thalassocella blandensis]|nr:Ferrichrome-iron receptor [Thalassocella blandensis]